MNELSAVVNRLSISSREIAELTGKRHSDVLRDIDRLVGSLNADLRLGFQSSTYKDSTGKENREFLLDRDSAYCLMAGYDATARMKIIKRWQELEAQQKKPLTQIEIILQSAQLLAEQEKRLDAMEQKVSDLNERLTEPNRETIVIHNHFIHQPDDPYYSQGYSRKESTKKPNKPN